jgi:hypothetical protein
MKNPDPAMEQVATKYQSAYMGNRAEAPSQHANPEITSDDPPNLPWTMCFMSRRWLGGVLIILNLRQASVHQDFAVMQKPTRDERIRPTGFSPLNGAATADQNGIGDNSYSL